MIKVSIIVPVYKAENYISKCVESLISQSLKEIEIILVDDGSPDKSGMICDEYAKKDNRIKVIHKENGGVSSARNIGIEAAVGEYILFVDSDDWVENDYAESLLSAQSSFLDCEIACGFRTVSDYEGSLLSNVIFSDKERISKIQLDKYMDLVSAWLAQSPCNKLFKRIVILNENIRFIENLSLGEDMYFCLEYYSLCGSETIRCINKPLYNYIRTEKESLDNKYYSNILEIDKLIYDKLKECLLFWGADEEQIKKFYNARFYRYVYALENTYKQGNKASEKEKRRTNSSILKSAEFKEAFSKVTSYIHPIHKMAYKSGCWCLVKIAYLITSLKNKLIRKK